MRRGQSAEDRAIPLMYGIATGDRKLSCSCGGRGSADGGVAKKRANFCKSSVDIGYTVEYKIRLAAQIDISPFLVNRSGPPLKGDSLEFAADVLA
jgi:hypothetical protein